MGQASDGEEGISYEALANGLLPCADARQLQETCNSLGAADIERLFRR
jgi:hypothetical protein